MPHNAFSFTAIDFETAQGPRWSICQIGLVKVENYKVVETMDLLVKPPDNFYSSINIAIHGITPSKTLNSPNFSAVWPKIQKYIAGQNLVAHNASFDKSCLEQTLKYYRLPIPSFSFNCTYKLYGQNLKSLCEKFKITFNHHNALSDALACAKLYLLYHK